MKTINPPELSCYLNICSVLDAICFLAMVAVLIILIIAVRKF